MSNWVIMTNTSALTHRSPDSGRGVTARPSPRQRRSVERVQALLRAAEALLGEQGYEAATLKAVGERAGIPTASVYHYFADRHQLDAEVLRHHLREVDRRLEAALDEAEPQSLCQAVDIMFDTLLACYREYPSLVELWFAGRTPRLSELARDHDATQAAKLWRWLTAHRLLRADTPPSIVEIAIEAGDRLFDMAFRHSSTGDDAVVDEARCLVTAYLERYAPWG